MASYYKEGGTVTFNGFKGTITRITETYKKNVIVLKVTQCPKYKSFSNKKIDTIGLFEYPDGRLEFMSIID